MFVMPSITPFNLKKYKNKSALPCMFLRKLGAGGIIKIKTKMRRKR